MATPTLLPMNHMQYFTLWPAPCKHSDLAAAAASHQTDNRKIDNVNLQPASQEGNTMVYAPTFNTSLSPQARKFEHGRHGNYNSYLTIHTRQFILGILYLVIDVLGGWKFVL